MAPEILRYEKYGAKADLWSVGAVLFEMSVGKPPFRANNHVELLRKIEKGEDRIKFPDESSRVTDDALATEPVSPDIKALIRGLLRRHPVQRMDFDAFFQCGIWDGYMTESTTEEGSLSLEISTDSSGVNLAASNRVKEMFECVDSASAQALPRTATVSLPTQQAVNPQTDATIGASYPSEPATAVPSPLSRINQSLAVARRSEPKYYVSDDSPTDQLPLQEASALVNAPVFSSTILASSRPIQTPIQRRLSSREKELSSIEDAQPLTPNSLNAPQPSVIMTRSNRVVGEGSPLAATPPLTMERDEEGIGAKDESALYSSDSVVGRDYVATRTLHLACPSLLRLLAWRPK